jgi:hydrogenase maturation protease
VYPRTEPPRAKSRPPKVTVIGVGNLLLKDEGVGIHVIRAIQEKPPECNSDVTIIEGGTCPDILYLLSERVEKLLIVDAVKGGGEPGSIYRFAPDDIEFRRGTITSVHQLGLAEGFKAMEFSDVKPEEIVIIGVEPYEVAWGLEISPELQGRVPEIIALVEKEMRIPEDKHSLECKI